MDFSKGLMIIVLPAIAKSLDQMVMVAKMENAPANLDTQAINVIIPQVSIFSISMFRDKTKQEFFQ